MVINTNLIKSNRLKATKPIGSIKKIKDAQITTLDLRIISSSETTPSLPKIFPQKQLSVKESLMNSMFHSSVPDDLKDAFFETAKQLPEELLKLLNRAENKISVISPNEDAPIPFHVEEFDIDFYKKNITTMDDTQKKLSVIITPVILKKTKTIRQLAQEHGAKTINKTKEFAELILMANPKLASWEITSHPKNSYALDLVVNAGEEILLPAFHYYKGMRIPSGASNAAYEVLTNQDNLMGQFKCARRNIDGNLIGGYLAIDIPAGILFWDAIILPNNKKNTTLKNEDGLAHNYISHEIGHAFAYALKSSEPLFYNSWWSKIIALYNRRCKENEKINHFPHQIPSLWPVIKQLTSTVLNKEPFVTTYSMENDEEFFAEGVAAFFSIQPGVPKRPDTATGLAKERLPLTKEVLKDKDRELYDLIQEAVDHIQLHSQTIAA